MNPSIDHLNHPAHPDHDPAKDRNWVPLTSEAQTEAARVRTLDLINQAQSLLYEAAQAASPLKGWVKPWEWIGDHADKTKALWHRINNAKPPTGHDQFPKTEA